MCAFGTTSGRKNKINAKKTVERGILDFCVFVTKDVKSKVWVGDFKWKEYLRGCLRSCYVLICPKRERKHLKEEKREFGGRIRKGKELRNRG